MKILGIDYGEKKVGIAISDEKGKMAFPNCVLRNSGTLALDILNLAKKEGVSIIVLGESRDFGGRANPVMAAIQKLKGELERRGFTVRLQQEYSSSVEARRFQGENDMHDASAAAIILQRYLDTHINL